MIVVNCSKQTHFSKPYFEIFQRDLTPSPGGLTPNLPGDINLGVMLGRYERLGQFGHFKLGIEGFPWT